MLKGNMLISVEAARTETTLAKPTQEIERLLGRFHMINPRTWLKKICKPFANFINLYTNVGRAIERTPKIGGFMYLKRTFPDMPDSVVGHLVRTLSGSPDFMRLGRAHPFYNSFLLFSNAIKEGYRGDMEAMMNTPAGFWWKKAKYVFLPKMLMCGLSLGLGGDDYQEVFNGVNDYDMANYIIIPLGLTPNGSSVYLRMPTDESARLMGGILMKAMNRERPQYIANLIDYMAGQAPTLNPAIDAMWSTIEYVSGRNPYDSFRGRYAIADEQVWRAHDLRTHKAFIKWLLQKHGANIVYRFDFDDIEEVKTEFEKVLGYPVLSNIVGRFIKVSQTGVKEKFKLSRELEKRARARKYLDAREAMAKMINGKPLTDKDLVALALKPGVLDRGFLRGVARRYGESAMEQLWSVDQTGTPEEKLAVIQKIIELDALGRKGDEHRWLWDKWFRKERK